LTIFCLFHNATNMIYVCMYEYTRACTVPRFYTLPALAPVAPAHAERRVVARGHYELPQADVRDLREIFCFKKTRRPQHQKLINQKEKKNALPSK
jgi:hypothetical protein